jgi:hypothetical protein
MPLDTCTSGEVAQHVHVRLETLRDAAWEALSPALSVAHHTINGQCGPPLHALLVLATADPALQKPP